MRSRSLRDDGEGSYNGERLYGGLYSGMVLSGGELKNAVIDKDPKIGNVCLTRLAFGGTLLISRR